MAWASVYPQEFRGRAVNLVIEATPEHTSRWAAIETIGRQLGERRDVRSGAAGGGQRRPAAALDHRLDSHKRTHTFVGTRRLEE